MGKSSIQGVTGKRSFPDGIDPDGLVKIDRVQGWISITLYVCPSVCVLLCLFVPQSVYVATFANWSSRCLPLSLIFLSLSLPLSRYGYPVCLYVYMSVCMSVSVSVCLFLSLILSLSLSLSLFSLSLSLLLFLKETKFTLTSK